MESSEGEGPPVSLVVEGGNGLGFVMASLLLVAGSIFFPGLFLLLQRFWLATKAGSKVRAWVGLTEKDYTDISVKTVSAFQAILASITGIIVCSNCFQNVLHASHPATLVYAWFGIPYFIYDAFAMYYASRASVSESTCGDDKDKPKKIDFLSTDVLVKGFIKFCLKSPIIVIHHLILAPYGFYLLVFCRDGVRNGDFFMGVIYLMEISTPFVSMRFVLSKFKLKSSTIYTVNGVAMLLLFPVFRIASVFYAVKLYAEQNGLYYFEALWNIPFGWKIVCLAAIAPQLYWYFLMWNGLIKMLRKTPPNVPLKEKVCENENLQAKNGNSGPGPGGDTNGRSSKPKDN